MRNRKYTFLGFMLMLVLAFTFMKGLNVVAHPDLKQPKKQGDDGYIKASSEGGEGSGKTAGTPSSIDALQIAPESKTTRGSESDPEPMGIAVDESSAGDEISQEGAVPRNIVEDPTLDDSSFPTEIRSWEGPTQMDSGSIPPDPAVAAGPQHVVVAVNPLIRMYDRKGVQEVGTTAGAWYEMLPSGSEFFRPRLLYDRTIDRFIMVWVARKTSAKESWFLVSCSKTADPTAGWWNYALDATLRGSTETDNWADFPRIGVANRAITLAANMHGFETGDFQHTKVRILKKADICSGGEADWWDEWGLENVDGTDTFTIVPAHQLETLDEQYMVNAENGASDEITMWKVVDPIDFTNGPDFYHVNPTGISPYTVPPDAKQPEGKQDLDNAGTRMLHAVLQRGSMFATHTDAVDWSSDSSGDRSTVRYYKIDSVSASPFGDYQVSYGAGGRDYFYPSVSVDSAGNVVIGMAVSGENLYPSAKFAGVSIETGAIGSSDTCAAGVDTYVQKDSEGRNRWGNYSDIAVAPDRSTFYLFNGYVGAVDTWYSRICAVRYKQRTRVDFDIDGDTDISVYRPSNGKWYIKGRAPILWGISGDIPVPGDYDGDGDTDLAVYRPSNGMWYVKDVFKTWWGLSNDVPMPGDYDGDGTTDVAVYRPSNGKWYVKDGVTEWWGLSGDIPVPGDYDGDGTTDVAVYRPSNGKWYVKDGVTEWWGLSGDIPVPGDYDGDGTTDVAVYRPSNGKWYVKDGVTEWWGLSGDIPVPGDYDGDGTSDVAVLRPSNGTWYIKDQTNTWHYLPGDYPLPVRDTNGDGDPYH